jgi:hypothetical protein
MLPFMDSEETIIKTYSIGGVYWEFRAEWIGRRYREKFQG